MAEPSRRQTQCSPQKHAADRPYCQAPPLGSLLFTGQQAAGLPALVHGFKVCWSQTTITEVLPSAAAVFAKLGKRLSAKDYVWIVGWPAELRYSAAILRLGKLRPPR
ncbi:hypothetical protein NDU88_002558 [Pleurodeles waltl]|uniref:Uncharacterized protein n=1 Tax=Pleurodeles waltl TaxID=8319 RepID=A0AAV7LEF5_PLEWA|nr:hypothetical protein NDU88_002558 [Pleurodeles waltl]